MSSAVLSGNLKTDGNNEFNSKNYIGALKFYQKAIELDPTNYVLYRNSCVCFSALQRFKEAYTSISNSIQLNPQEAKSYYWGGKVCIALDRYDEARAWLIQGEQLEPTNREILLLLRIAVEEMYTRPYVLQKTPQDIITACSNIHLLRLNSHFMPQLIFTWMKTNDLSDSVITLFDLLSIKQVTICNILAAQNPYVWINNFVAFAQYFNIQQSYTKSEHALCVAERWTKQHHKSTSTTDMHLQLLSAYYHWIKGWMLCDIQKSREGLAELDTSLQIYHNYKHKLSARKEEEMFNCMNNIAVAEWGQGNFGAAEQLFTKIMRKYKGGTQEFRAMLSNNVAAFAANTGMTGLSSASWNTAINLHEKHSLPWLTAKANMASQYTILGDTQNAIAILHEIIPVFKQRYPNNPDYVMVQLLLANISMKNGNLLEAKNSLLELLQHDVPNFRKAIVLAELASVYCVEGNLSLALEHSRNSYSLAIESCTLVDCIPIAYRYATILILVGDFIASFPVIINAKDLVYTSVTSFYDQFMQSEYLNHFLNLISLFVFYIEKVYNRLHNLTLTKQNTQREMDYAYQICIFLVNCKVYADRLTTTYKNKHSEESVKLIEQYNRITQEYCGLIHDSEQANNLMDERKKLWDKLLHNNTIKDINILDISNSLPSLGAYIEYFVHLPSIELFVKANTSTTAFQYIGLVILPQSENVQIFSFGKCMDIDIGRLNPAYSCFNTRNTTDAGGVDSEGESPLEDLTRVLWHPLAKYVEDCRILFVSPVYYLTHMAIEALPQENQADSLLCDKYFINYVTSGQDLARMVETNNTKLSPPIVIANPNYNLNIKNNTTSNWTHRVKKFTPFRELAGTVREGKTSATLLHTKPIMGDDAVVAIVKNCRSPAVLHIATHGGYLDNQHIMAFAGVNSYQAGKEIPQDAADGLLHTYDLLSLSGSFVVLSACSTGMCGPHLVSASFGFRARFLADGASCLVVSLCPVEDDITEKFMGIMYEHLLNKGVTVNEAVHEARKVLRSKGIPPSVWSAFVIVGNGALHVRLE